MSVLAWTYLFVGGTFGLYLLIAWLARVGDTKGFYVAGQGVPAIANGMATGADWMSAASFISMAGLVAGLGYAGGVYLMGWTGGYVLLAVLLAPYLRKFGKYTVPDFVGDRYESDVARVIAVVCAVFISFTYVAGQMRGVGIVFSRFLEVDVTTGVIVGMVIVFVYATLGGMKGITWTQVAQYWVLITAFLIPAVAISIKLTGNPIPSLGLGGQTGDGVYLLDKLDGLGAELGFASYTEPFAIPKWDKLNVFCVALALMAGTAGLPHVIVRFYTVKNMSAARWSAFWALLFIALLYLTAPATAAFARYYSISSLQGATTETLPAWYEAWQKTGLVQWIDNGDGVVRYSNEEDNEIFRVDHLGKDGWAALEAQHQQWLDDTGGEDVRPALVAGGKSGLDPDILVLATPQMAELQNWIVAFIAAGGLAAALSTASGLLVVISSSVAHDLYFRVIDTNAPDKTRLLVGRIAIGVGVIVAGILGIYPPGFVGQVVAFAFGLAASSFFPAIVLGIFSKRLGTVPAVTGMLVGIGFTTFYILTQVDLLPFGLTDTLFGGPGTFLRDPWLFGINAQGIGTIGMVLNFAVTLALMPLFPPPSAETQAVVESLRLPEDPTAAVMLDENAAALH